MSYNTKRNIISASGLCVLTALFVLWCVRKSPSPAGFCSALLSAGLFAAVCLRFVPVWIRAWSEPEAENLNEPEKIGLKIAAAALIWELVIVFAAYLVRAFFNGDWNFGNYLPFWTSTDSYHYLCIARDWYLSEGELDRLVQLVFLPGYPLVVRAFSLLTGEYLIAGMLVSAVSFAGGCAVFYKLLRLDMSREKALRALKFLFLAPPVFFFAAPMSEALFFLLTVSCLYLMRRERFFASALVGALAAFTRSPGIILLVPLLFELVQARAKPKKYLSLLVLPLGFAAYLLVNYQVAGDAFKFMEYQREHWYQGLGYFWNTAAYQTDYALDAGYRDLLGLWLPNLAACFIALLLMFFGAKKLRASCTAWFLAYFVVTVGATWLLSAPRYLLLQLPLYMVLAELGEDRRLNAVLTVLSALGLLCYFGAFCLRWQVW